MQSYSRRQAGSARDGARAACACSRAWQPTSHASSSRAAALKPSCTPGRRCSVYHELAAVFTQTIARGGRTVLVPGVLHTRSGMGTCLGAAVHAEPLGAAVQNRLLGTPRRGRDEPDRAQAGPRARRMRQQRVRERAAAAELGRVQPDLLRA